MSAQPACSRCGALLSPGEAFCSACGQPVGAARPNAGLLLMGVVVAVGALGLMVVIAIGLWLYLGRAKPQVAPPTQTASAAVSAPASAVAEKPKPAEGDEFLGTWLAPDSYDTSSPAARAEISRVGDHLQFMDHGTRDKGEKTPRMELKSSGKGRLKGTYYVDQNEQQPVELELTASADKMVMTLSPPASEIVTETWVRAKGEAKKPEPSAKTEPASSGAEPVSAEQALRLVSREPKVQAFAKRLKAAGKKVHIELDPSEEHDYVVHVYELVEGTGDMPGHTATFGWYGVDRKTGKITEMVQ